MRCRDDHDDVSSQRELAGGGERALLAIGAPTTARALGVTDDEVVQALVLRTKVNKERYTILGDEGLTLEAAERLAKITKSHLVLVREDSESIATRTIDRRALPHRSQAVTTEVIPQGLEPMDQRGAACVSRTHGTPPVRSTRNRVRKNR